MKKTIILSGLALVFFGACKTSQVSSFSDDVYTSPSEERRLAQIAAAEKAKKDAEAREQQEQARLAQKAKDDANPYYQDPKADADDYYDYKYASRIQRFNDPLPGAGYYDSRYTNYYTYNQNPAMFGSSIYSSYNWMPSTQFGYYSSGISSGLSLGIGYSSGYPGYYNNYYGSPYNYSPYCYSPYSYYSPYSFGYSYDPFYSNYYNGYMNGYYNRLYNSGYGGWGYYNSYDANSGYGLVSSGPRGSNGGGNSGNRTTAGMLSSDDEGARSSFFRSMSEKQQSTPRFTETARNVRNADYNSSYDNNGSQTTQPRTYNNGRGGEYTGRDGNVNYNNNSGNTGSGNPRGSSSRVLREQSVNTNQSPTNSERNSGWNNNNSNSGGNWNGGGNSGNSGGGSSSPRNGGGGGNSRPR